MDALAIEGGAERLQVRLQLVEHLIRRTGDSGTAVGAVAGGGEKARRSSPAVAPEEEGKGGVGAGERA